MADPSNGRPDLLFDRQLYSPDNPTSDSFIASIQKNCLDVFVAPSDAEAICEEM